MILKKNYYSISEVSKMLSIKEHTIRFCDSKIPDLSKRDKKGKTRFFSFKQIEKISMLRDILKKNDSIKLAYESISKKNFKNQQLFIGDSFEKKNDSNLNQLKIDKIRTISNHLKSLIN